MAWVKVADRRLYCFEAGSGRPVVLLHGMGSSGVAWSPQVPALVDAGFRVLVPDMAGHGASAAPVRPFGVPDLVADLKAVLDTMGAAEADIVGVSMGGTIALATAARETGRIRRLVVVNAGPSTDLPGFDRMLSNWAATLRGEDGPLALLAELWPLWVSDDFARSEEGRRTWQHWSAATAAVDGSGMAYVMDGVAGHNGDALLGSIAARTLFMGGSQDPASTVMRQLSGRVADARYTEIDGARHIANADRADAFNHRLLEFLA